MSSEEHKTESAGNGQRPSLGGAPGSKGDQLSILASVEGNACHAAAPMKRRRWPWLMSAAFAVAALGYFALRLPLGALPETASPSFADSGPTATPPSAQAAAAPVSPSAPASSIEEASTLAAHAPARIETVASPGDAMVSTSTDHPFVKLNSDAAVSDEAEGAAVPAATAVAALSRPDTLNVAAAERRMVAKAPGSGPKKRATPQRDRTAKRDPSAGDDADVDLLAALMAHVSGNQATAAGRPVARVRVSHAAPTIAELVKGCSAMAATAARHCRQRICEGYWGKAEACPVNARPAR